MTTTAPHGIAGVLEMTKRTTTGAIEAIGMIHASPGTGAPPATGHPRAPGMVLRGPGPDFVGQI